VIGHEGRLRAGIKPHAARRHHHILQKHPVIQPGTLFQIAMDGENQAHRRIKENQVAAMLGAHAFSITLTNAKQAIKIPAHFAAAAMEWFEEFARIILVFRFRRDARFMFRHQRIA